MDRYCTNCRAEIPPKADSCPVCGVYAGDVFDGTWPRKKSRVGLWLTLLVLALAAAAAAVWFERKTAATARDVPPELPPVRVVSDRPGGSRRAKGARVTEAEAVRLLRRRILSTTRISNDCLVLIGDRGRSDYAFTAHDRCSEVRLGRWRVDPKSGEASPLRPE